MNRDNSALKSRSSTVVVNSVFYPYMLYMLWSVVQLRRRMRIAGGQPFRNI